MNISTEERFLLKVDKSGKNGCWEWVAGNSRSDYGRIRLNKKTIQAHRMSWIIHNGPIQAGLCVLHTCQNIKCVNPEHLFLGTQDDNMKDMRAKVGSLVGERHNLSKLTSDKVRCIRTLKRDFQFTNRELAKMFLVVHSLISAIITRKIWKHI